MEYVIIIIMACVSILISTLVALYSSEILCSLPAFKSVFDYSGAPPFVVLVPAHDEELNLECTLVSLRQQCRPGDRILVIADNCSDGTEVIAKELGAEVSARIDFARVGKGYALEHGFKVSRSWNLPVTIIIDADCTADDGALIKLSALCASTGRPVQANYQMSVSNKASLRLRYRAFAFRVKNHARALGCARMGLSCLLNGSGMAFPSPLLNNINLGSSELAEDLLITVDCARQGAFPLYCADAVLHTKPTVSIAGQKTQQRRWEQGYLSVARRFAVALMLKGLRQGSVKLALLGLDIAIPPFSLLVGISFSNLIISLIAPYNISIDINIYFNITLVIILTCTIAMSWLRHGRALLSIYVLPAFVIFSFQKIPMYLAMLKRGRISWIRTERD